jgi:rhodanese-related sulfurtransferase
MFPLSAQADDKAVDDVDVESVWKSLQSEPRSKLVDVRTRAEWTYVGIPDLAPVGKRTVLVEWQTFLDQAIDPRFAEHLAGELKALGVELEDDLFFNCRSGSRSLAAAQAMAAMGYPPVTTSRAVSKGRSTTGDIGARSRVGKPLVCPGGKARNEA